MVSIGFDFLNDAGLPSIEELFYCSRTCNPIWKYLNIYIYITWYTIFIVWDLARYSKKRTCLYKAWIQIYFFTMECANTDCIILITLVLYKCTEKYYFTVSKWHSTLIILYTDHGHLILTWWAYFVLDWILKYIFKKTDNRKDIA